MSHWIADIRMFILRDLHKFVRYAGAFFFGVLMVLLPFYLLFGDSAFAQSEVERLREQIEDRNSRLTEIEAEIARYKAELQQVGAEKDTLQNAIHTLELERQKVQADITYTQNKIGKTDLQISKLSLEIGKSEDLIDHNKDAIMEILRLLNAHDQEALILALLGHENLAEFWKAVTELETVRNAMSDELKELITNKLQLEIDKTDNAEKRAELIALKEQYADQNKVLAHNAASKADLLEKTESKEQEYQRMIEEKNSAREQLLTEIRTYESKIDYILDPTKIPTSGTAVFNWPLSNIIITQYFGGTEFAKRNASVYAGRAYHPGVDFGASIGTPILAPLSGVVRATGNTDAVAGCYSWGKWTLIDHANGLTTLYAHQSVISVTPGQSVSTGDIIGYTGDTGYVTGPHLHFTVYAQDGVTVRYFRDIKTVTNCGAAQTPVAATEAYLDPMDYLPSL